ncbi:flagellar biosynthesis/type III secretory pathway chaperone [Bacillus ectoiniformans]|uniref:flagellar protein FlgN n=1 Tax=Bacillus ectoiniformans TaxID=1494429 RepID=UPI00195BF22C|nr:flagellar protein FlgN [Bacillus ectoiniformans]MBM7649358.1 flagellar biosynthesis/type III secretory pathway chaperone [Bacillus ectoiniformans]
MAQHQLMTVLDKMYRLHQLLLELAEKKTEIIKANDMNGLDQMLKDEQKYVAAIQTMERERQKVTAEWTGRAETTLSECINQTSGEVREKLEGLRNQLMDITAELKERNDLNQKLVYQSLQFVNISMNMLQPQPEQPTYGNPAKQSARPAKRSMFDKGV